MIKLKNTSTLKKGVYHGNNIILGEHTETIILDIYALPKITWVLIYWTFVNLLCIFIKNMFFPFNIR